MRFQFSFQKKLYQRWHPDVSERVDTRSVTVSSVKVQKSVLPKHQALILILDNRDSFVYNLVHRFAELGYTKCVVVRSDVMTLEQLQILKPHALVVSPGPGHPNDAGISVEAIRYFAEKIPILGVCLGHQAIAVAFHGVVTENGMPKHGQSTLLTHINTGFWKGISQDIPVARYHALSVQEPLPSVLKAQAWSEGMLMAMRHQAYPTLGFQFHPESILTPDGYALLERFCALIERSCL